MRTSHSKLSSCLQLHWNGSERDEHPLLVIRLGRATREFTGEELNEFADAIISQVHYALRTRLSDEAGCPEQMVVVAECSGASTLQVSEETKSCPENIPDCSARIECRCVVLNLETGSAVSARVTVWWRAATRLVQRCKPCAIQQSCGGFFVQLLLHKIVEGSKQPIQSWGSAAFSRAGNRECPCRHNLRHLQRAADPQASHVLKLIKRVSLTLNRYYPGRMHRFYLVDLPRMLRWPVKAIIALGHPTTRAKVVLCDADDPRLPQGFRKL